MLRLDRLRGDIDTVERHRLVAQLAGKPETLLDVGGIPGRLEPLLPTTDIVTANVMAPAEVVFAGERLPFADRSFDVVTSLDVLEHLEPGARPVHISELLRVGRSRAVVCTPLGTPDHRAAERELADWYAALSGERHPFLDEHVEHGLLDEPELRDLSASTASGYRWRVLYHGDFAVNQELFRLEALAHFRRGLADRLRFALRRLTVRLSDELAPVSHSRTNRAFVLVEIDGNRPRTDRTCN